MNCIVCKKEINNKSVIIKISTLMEGDEKLIRWLEFHLLCFIQTMNNLVGNHAASFFIKDLE